MDPSIPWSSMILALLAAIAIETGWDGNRTARIFTPPIEVAVEHDRGQMALVLPVHVAGVDLSFAVGPSYVAARAWLADPPPPPRLYSMVNEVDHIRYHDGREEIIVRTHLYGNKVPIDWFTWEYHIRAEPLWELPDRHGRVSRGVSRSEAMMYVGKRIGPIFARFGTNESLNRWNFTLVRGAKYA